MAWSLRTVVATAMIVSAAGWPMGAPDTPPAHAVPVGSPSAVGATLATQSPTVPLLTGGLVTTSGSGTATAQRTDTNGTSDQQSVQLTASAATYMTDLQYPDAPRLTPDQYPPSPQAGYPGALTWPTDLGSASEDFSYDGGSWHCDYQLHGTQPWESGAPQSGQFFPPFSAGIDSRTHSCNSDQPYASSSLAYDVGGQVNLDLAYTRATKPVPATQTTRPYSINEPVTAWDCSGNTSCGSNLTWSGTVTVHCMLCVTDISFQQLADPTSGSDALADVPDTGTYDGNRVEVTATITNFGTRAVTTQVNFVDGTTHRFLPQDTGTTLAQPISFPAGATTKVTYEWDTSGFAWENGAGHPDRQVEVLTPLGGAYRDITVLPKPAVLVHGFWSNADTAWSDMKRMLARVDPDWNGYAVGDNPTWSPPMDTDPLDGASIDANAFTLGKYVESLRKETGAQHIDLVGHSMGGLISRDYIDKIMGNLPKPPGDRPVASHLVMLGTPNQGSPCAYPASKAASWFGAGTPTYQLRPDFIAGPFDQTVTQERGVKFSVLAGYGYGVCGTSTEGDLVVSVASAWWHYTDVAKMKDKHTDLTGDDNVVSSFIAPHLALDPTQVHQANPARAQTDRRAGRPTPAASTATIAPENGQTAMIADAPLPANGTKRERMQIARGVSQIQAVVLAPSTVGLTLTDPTGHVATRQAAGSAGSTQPFRVLRTARPKPGTWTLTLHTTSPATTLTTIDERGTIPTLSVSARQTPTGHVVVTASLAHRGTHYIGVTMTSRIRAASPVPSINLRDDGRHHDAKAHDGIYGASTGKLPQGHYFVTVKAERPGLTRYQAAVT